MKALVAAVLVLPSVLANTKSPSLVSPVPNFEKSWIASCSQGTTVAIEYPRSDERTGIVLVSTRKSTAKRLKDDEDELSISGNQKSLVDGLPVQAITPFSETGTSQTLWHSDCIVSFTGLFSDVDHVGRVLRQKLDNHQVIFERSRRDNAFSVARHLSEILLHKDGRPYGIQALVVGGSASNNQRMRLYTLDPSGGYRNWGLATAIGRNAKAMRSAIYKQVSEASPETAREALAVALQSLREVVGDDFSTDSEEIVAWLCWEDRGVRIGLINKNVVEECLSSNIGTPTTD